MVAPSPQNLQLRAWIRDFILNSGELTDELESQIAAILGTVLTARGDLLTRDGTGVVRLAKGAQNTLLAMGANDPAWVTLSAEIDNAIGSTRGGILYRGASGWAKLDPGTSGQFLKSNGAGADPSYQDAVFSASWTRISSTTISGDTTLTGLAGYASILAIGKAVTTSASTDRRFQVSTDNGSSFVSTGYVLIDSSTSVESSGGSISLTGASASALGFWIMIPNWNTTGGAKMASLSKSGQCYITNTSAFNALKIFGSTSALTGGTIDLYGITA